MTRSRITLLCSLFLTGLLVTVGLSSLPVAAQQFERPQPPGKQKRSSLIQRSDLNRRLVELDRLLTLGSLVRAESLLENLAQHKGIARELRSRRIALTKLKGEHEEAVRLCNEALKYQPGNARLLREMAGSLLELGQTAAASVALTDYIAASPNRRSSVIVSVELLGNHGNANLALALCDSARLALNDPRFMGRQRAVLLLETDRELEAADEVISELRTNPLNLPLIRQEILADSVNRNLGEGFIDRMLDRVVQVGATPSERVLLADLLLLRADVERAREAVLPLLGATHACFALLRSAATLAREAALIDDRRLRAATTEYLLLVLEDLVTNSALDAGNRPRALETLARVCEEALMADLLADDPQAAVDRFERLLNLVKRGNRYSPHLYSAQIRLAHFTRDELGKPAQAAARLERLLTDLDLPDEGVALTRLTLGECYLAAGDTSRGRLVLTRLGRSREYKAAAGHAHYHLARLDLAEGHFGTARDRFAVVAMDNPAAPYANDALDLGLAVAEELENPTGGPVVLNSYSHSVYFELVAQPDSQLVALENFVRSAPLRVDLSQPQHLLERGRIELARLYWRQELPEQALAQCDRIVMDHPDGRYPAAALALRGRILAGTSEKALARQAYERLLAQYSEYLFADDIRDSLRSLP